MGLDSSGETAMDGVGSHLMKARATLMQTLAKTKEVELAISKSGVRLQNMREGLPALQAALKPLEAQALVVNGLEMKIQKAAEPAERVLETFEVVHSLERVLKGDPHRDFGEYLASLSQLEEAQSFLSQRCVPAVQSIKDAVSFLAQSRAADHYRLYRLNERLVSVSQEIKSEEENSFDMGLLKIALEKLELEFRRILLENSLPMELPERMPIVSRTGSDIGRGGGGGGGEGEPEPEPEPELEQLSFSLPPVLPFAATEMLQTMVERLSYHKRDENLLEIYRECRIAPIKRSLENLGASTYLEYSTPQEIDELPWEELEGMVGLWSQHVEVACKLLFKSERRLCTRIFSKVEKTKWIRCWGKLGTAGFLPFLAFGEAVALSRIAPEKLFKLLDMYDMIEKCNHSILEMFEGGDPACGEIILRARELQKKLVFKASETVSGFIRMVSEDRSDVPRYGERSSTASYVMNYVSFVASDYASLLSKVLRIHRRMETGLESPEDLLAKSAGQVVDALEKRLIERSTTYTDRSLGYIFMMNNYYYMISHVKREDSRLGPLLGDKWHKDMLGRLRQSTLHYQRETWGKMLELLKRDGLQSSSGSKGSSREMARQRLRSFTQAFDQTCQKHSNWTISSEDLRVEVEVAVTQTLIPAYRSYTSAFKNLLEQGGTRHYKYSPEDIEQIIGDLFQPRAQDSRPRNGKTDSIVQLTHTNYDFVFSAVCIQTSGGNFCGQSTSRWGQLRIQCSSCFTGTSAVYDHVYSSTNLEGMDDDVWQHGLRYATLKKLKEDASLKDAKPGSLEEEDGAQLETCRMQELKLLPSFRFSRGLSIPLADEFDTR
ncbi:hypothetical protein R1sor_004294 [Riccia sorocarpa]|uniref:Exocyst subunit Exo70 family protein n=1 Tax=Riccia sorocarpa TaxID=122646 RepID=A0ABD3HGY1_9MARC